MQNDPSQSQLQENSQKSLKSFNSQNQKPVKISKNFIKKFKEQNNINIKKLKPNEISFSKNIDEMAEKQKLVEKLEKLQKDIELRNAMQD